MAALDPITDKVTQVATDVGKGFLSTLVSAPLDFLKGGINTLGGFARGVFGSLWTGATITAVLTGVKLVAPSLWGSVAEVAGGKEYAQGLARKVEEGGIPAVLMDSAIQGFGAAGVIGGAQGALAGDGESNGIAGTFGKYGVIAGVGTVLLGAVLENGLPFMQASNDSKTPPVVPSGGDAKVVEKS